MQRSFVFHIISPCKFILFQTDHGIKDAQLQVFMEEEHKKSTVVQMASQDNHPDPQDPLKFKFWIKFAFMIYFDFSAIL